MPESMRFNTHASKTLKKAPGPDSRKNGYSHPLLKMQKSIGNRAILHLRDGLGTLQTKLSLGAPHDIYEQEADSVARQVVKQISHVGGQPGTSSDAPLSSPALQRQEDEEMLGLRRSERIQRQDEEELLGLRRSENIQRQVEGEEEEEELIQPRQSENIQRQTEGEEEEEPVQLRRSENIQRQEEEEYAALSSSSEADQSGQVDQGPVSEAVENQVQRARQGGAALDTSTRSRMEGGFGYDFGGVNIHNDAASDNIAQQLNAEAFTVKGDIFFRNGRYNPSSSQGQDLLAHELTHVVQQGSAASRNANPPAENVL